MIYWRHKELNVLGLRWNDNYSCEEKERFEFSKNLADLIKSDDLLIIEDRTTNYPYKTFPLIYDEKTPFAYECAIYHLLEWYIKDEEGNYIKVAERKGEKIELV